MRLLLAAFFLMSIFVSKVASQDLRFSEFAYQNSGSATSGVTWIEFENVSSEPLNLATFTLSLDTINGTEWSFPDLIAPPKSFIVVFLSGFNSTSEQIHSELSITFGTRYIALRQNGLRIDLLSFPSLPGPDESFSRNPLRQDEFIYLRADQITRGAENYRPIVWKRITNRAEFQPRDSSPNACLVYDNKIWMLAGYRKLGDTWASRSDVWNSEDGIHWTQISSTAPYDPYSAYAVFQGRMWAFDPYGCYSSTDGITWTAEAEFAFPGGWGARITVFQNELWFYNNRTIGKSSDGINWEIVMEDVPWEGDRLWPAFLAHQGKLIFFGGAINYFTGEDYYFRDVWSSSNGRDWQKLTDEAPWVGRFWFNYASFDSKIWMMGGWNYYDLADENWGNRNDVWTSSDGENWSELISDETWSNRHALLSFVKDNALYVSSGYGGGGEQRMNSDVWVCERKNDLSALDLPDTVEYGYQSALASYPNLQVRVSNDVLSIKSDSISATRIGTTSYSVQFPGDETYYPLSYHRLLTVRKKKLHVSVVDTARVYRSPNPDIRLTYSNFAFAESDTTAFQAFPTTLSTAEFESNVGKYPIFLQGGVASNYDLVLDTGILTITPRPILAKPSDVERKYGEPNPAVTVKFSDETNGLLETPAITMPTIDSPPGKYPIVLSGGTTTTNYKLILEDGTITINPAQLIVKARDTFRAYGDENPKFIVDYSGFVNGQDSSVLDSQPVVSTTASIHSNVGSYALSVQGGHSSNYDMQFVNGTLSVNPRQLVVKATDFQRKYLDVTPELTLTYTGLAEFDSIESAFTTLPNPYIDASQASQVGEYKIEINKGIAPNYSVSYLPGLFTVVPRRVHVSAPDTSRYYGEPNPIITVKYEEDVLELIEAPQIEIKASIKSEIGQYLVKVIGGTTSPNYELVPVDGSLTILPRQLYVLAKDTARSFNEPNPEFEINYEGFVLGETDSVLIIRPIVVTDANDFAEVGSYELRPTGGEALNYQLTYRAGKLVVKEAAVVGLFPNPVRDHFTITAPYKFQPSDQIRIYSALGHPVNDFTFIKTGNLMRLDVSLPPGVYFYHITSGGKLFRGNFVAN